MALSSYGHITEKRVRLCELPLSCQNVLKTGTDFGFALSHRQVSTWGKNVISFKFGYRKIDDLM